MAESHETEYEVRQKEIHWDIARFGNSKSHYSQSIWIQQPNIICISVNELLYIMLNTCSKIKFTVSTTFTYV